MAEIDWVLLRELADEFGYWPATTEPADIQRRRRLNAALGAPHLHSLLPMRGSTSDGQHQMRFPTFVKSV